MYDWWDENYSGGVTKQVDTSGRHRTLTWSTPHGDLVRTYKLDAPKGVAGRNSDNAMIKRELGWEPDLPLREGMAKTYAWIKEQYLARKAGKATVE